MIKFTELFKDETKYGTKIKAGEYNTVGKYPIVDQGKNLIAGYTNREDGIYKNVPVIIFGDHTRIIKYIDKPFFLGADGVKILKSKKENANYRYLYYALRNVHIPNTGYNRHFKWLKEIYIRYPSDKEQESMVKTLDSISSIMNKKRKEVEYLDCLVKARFVEMFGDLQEKPKKWRKSTIGTECYYIKDGPHKSPQYIDDDNGIPFISTRNIVNGDGIDWSTAKYISEEDYQKCIKKCHPIKGDILYSKGGTTGIAKYVNVNRKFANWVHVAVLKFGPQLNGVYFEHMLNSDYCYRQSQYLTKGIANKDLVLSSIAKIKIVVPPIEIQNNFAYFVKRVAKL